VFGRLNRPQDFIGALDRLFGDLVAEGTRPEDFRDALESRADRDRFERNRDGELQVIYSEYLARLREKGRRDGRDNLLDCANAIAADPAGLAERLGVRRELRLFGLQDLRGGRRALLRALVGSGGLDRLVIYTAEELELGLEQAPRVTRVEEAESVAGSLFSPEARPLPPLFARGQGDIPQSQEIQAIAAPDVERELEDVARRVRALADEGVPLHRIAVIARQARPYVDLALAALERFGVPATARRRVAWSEIPVIRAVRSLLAAAAEGWTRHGLAELAEQQYFRNELDVRLVNYAGFRRRLHGLDAWTRALQGIAQEAAAHEEREARGEETDERQAPLPPAARAREAAGGFAAFAGRAAELDPPRTLNRWLAWLGDFLHADPWGMERRIWRVPASRYDIARLDLAGWRGLTRLVDGWRGALEEWGGSEVPLTAEGFFRQFLDLLDGDAALWTETQRGLQVLEGLAAAYRLFDHVFLVGLEAGRFPLPAPVSPILDDRERDTLSAAGLPLESRAVWDARERELFRVLVAVRGSRSPSPPRCSTPADPGTAWARGSGRPARARRTARRNRPRRSPGPERSVRLRVRVEHLSAGTGQHHVRPCPSLSWRQARRWGQVPGGDRARLRTCALGHSDRRRSRLVRRCPRDVRVGAAAGERCPIPRRRYAAVEASRLGHRWRCSRGRGCEGAGGCFAR